MIRMPSHRGPVLLALVLSSASVAVAAMTPESAADTIRWNGAPTALGSGEVRSYVISDASTGAPLEIGVAMTEAALEGLPALGSGHHGEGHMPHTYLLDLPQDAGPFRFVELNWNPAGHEPEGVYAGVPHFDFHFYTIEKAEREAIVPSDPAWADKANRIPGEAYVPAFNVPLGPPGAPPAAVAVPMMGVHWSDVRSPELQGVLGKPEAYRPFTATFIHGSWDGELIFWEPMITRAHILSKKAAGAADRDEVIEIPTPAEYREPGHYPQAYRITWDGEAREYRIALTRLAARP